MHGVLTVNISLLLHFLQTAKQTSLQPMSAAGGDPHARVLVTGPVHLRDTGNMRSSCGDSSHTVMHVQFFFFLQRAAAASSGSTSSTLRRQMASSGSDLIAAPATAGSQGRLPHALPACVLVFLQQAGEPVGRSIDSLLSSVELTNARTLTNLAVLNYLSRALYGRLTGSSRSSVGTGTASYALYQQFNLIPACLLSNPRDLRNLVCRALTSSGKQTGDLSTLLRDNTRAVCFYGSAYGVPT
jgi:hypothetical protein